MAADRTYIRVRRSLAAILLALILTGCDPSGEGRSDQRYRDCITAGGSYREPVSDGIGYACDMPGGDDR